MAGFCEESVFAVILKTRTVRDTGRWAGVDSVREQEKLEAWKMFENGNESHLPSARFVRHIPVATS